MYADGKNENECTFAKESESASRVKAVGEEKIREGERYLLLKALFEKTGGFSETEEHKEGEKWLNFELNVLFCLN